MQNNYMEIINCPVCFSKSQRKIKTKFKTTNIFSCKQCKTSYASPFIKEEFDETYASTGSVNSTGSAKDFIDDLKSTNYEKGINTSAIYLSTFTKRLNYWKKILGKKPSDKLKILEVGCSTGLAIESLSKLGQNVMGIDIDKDAISIGKRRNPNLNIYFGDIIKQKDIGPFDVIFASQVLEHFFTPLELLVKLRSLLKESNSLIHIDIPNHDSLSSFYYKLRPTSKRFGGIILPFHQIGYKRKSLEILFNKLEEKPEILKIFSCTNNHKSFGQSFPSPSKLKTSIVLNAYYGLSKITNSGGLLVAIAKF
ncbi:bifunctional 2-polyprenyl-6-hydroxyphenol methylase/3-demethylubiquinol 3-O-methyltransferase UbiG [uncultured Prochlorococcus sp.]|uniref:class I SAM-dependent methyltransferase n=1 Tax=uncultured Prochlorococcus sp. TaxID=159733 RepID=UPI002590EBB1|nr:class I SAM-dependent methyltransferase [uncultured Prochlorococcus sp.]